MSYYGTDSGWEDSGDGYDGDYGSVYGSNCEWVRGEVLEVEHRVGYLSDDKSVQGGAGGGYASDGYRGLTRYQNPNGKSSYGYSKNSNSQQVTYQSNTYDKQSGSYTKATVKESVSTGDVFKERSTGRVGHKDEFKTTSTYKFGDKSGYTEYQKEERFRHVDYGGSSSSSKSGYSSDKEYLK